MKALIPVLLMLVAVTSCDSPANEQHKPKWQVRSLQVEGMRMLPNNALSSNQLRKIQADYKTAPADFGVAELALFRVFSNSEEVKMVIVFNIDRVDDVQVVYEIAEGGEIVGKYLASEWN